jgi:cyclopropane-fatty-acyl-phospholipid synthase
VRTAIDWVERGLVPRPLVRAGIRRLLRARLREQAERAAGSNGSALDAWVREMRAAPVALEPQLANQQHYEVPPEFFERVLGARLKYSSGFYPTPTTTLDEAEEAMLRLTCERAGLEDGQQILELGCGWGSLSLWLAEHYPRSSVLAVSNSAPQRRFILDRAARRGSGNLTVVTADVNHFEPQGRFDRVVSVEMFEHLRNWEAQLQRIAGWLRPSGRLFLHVFAHRHFAYPFEDRDASDWMSRHFFSGGMMPSHGLLDRLHVPFVTEQRWVVPGSHYARTAEHWLANADREREALVAILRRGHGAQAELCWQRWRLFFLACAELFGYRGGEEWIVSHQLLRPSARSSRG